MAAATTVVWSLAGGGSELDPVQRFLCRRLGSPREIRSAVVSWPVTTEAATSAINSSTLINKGLEVIEAHHLFGMPFDKIAVIGRPQSCIHSMVDFVDGSTIAQVSPPDMRLAISLGLGWPDRVPGAATRFDWSQPQRGTYSHSTTRPFRRCNWPTKSAGPVAADPRFTTQPTRSASGLSSGINCPGWASWTPSREWSQTSGTPPRERSRTS